MPIDQATHDALTRVELRCLILACDECACEFECYCASNKEWAEAKLRKLDGSTNGELTASKEEKL